MLRPTPARLLLKGRAVVVFALSAGLTGSDSL